MNVKASRCSAAHAVLALLCCTTAAMAGNLQGALVPEEPYLENVVFFKDGFRYENVMHRVLVFDGQAPSYYFFHNAKSTSLSLGNDLPVVTKSANKRLVVIDGGIFNYQTTKNYFPGPGRPRTITMFRHPAKNLVSLYATCKYGHYAVQTGSAVAVPPMSEYLSFHADPRRQSKNRRKTKYNCFDPLNPQTKSMNGHSLIELFSFGLQEYYRESMCLINHAITGQMASYCRCGSKSPFLKRSQRTPNLQPTSAELKLITELTKKDRELYRQARILFIKRIRELEQKSGMQIFCPRKPGSAEIVWNSPGDRIRSIEMPEHLRHKDELVVFLDHGGFTWHEDVFYSVADLAYRMLGKPRNLLFLIDEFFAEYNNGGFEDFLAKYSTMGSIPNFRYKLVKIAAVTERPTYSMCSDFDAIKQKHGYDYRFAVTASLDDPDFRTDEEEWKGCMKKYKNSETDFFILHNVRAGGIEQNLIKEDWNNYIVVSNINEHGGKYHYLFSAIPVPQEIPRCDAAPVFLVHGRLSKKYMPELEVILSHRPKFNVTIRVMTRNELPLWAVDPRVEVITDSHMIPFNEAHIGCAFILPLLDPRFDKVGYFSGQTTSSIAFGFHFRLRFVGHQALLKMYEADLAPLDRHYPHDGTNTSVVKNFQKAVDDFQRWCRDPNRSKQWWKG